MYALELLQKYAAIFLPSLLGSLSFVTAAVTPRASSNIAVIMYASADRPKNISGISVLKLQFNFIRLHNNK